MENLRQGFVTAASALLVLTAGCVGLDLVANAPPAVPPVQAVATWQPYVLFAPDPARNGATAAGLAGRLYLFGPQLDHPIAAEGRLQVRLFPDPPDPAKPDTPLEVWEIDADTLRGKLQRDAIGWGYNLLLPWGTYRPELSHIRMTVRFDPVQGVPLFAQETHLNLHGQGPPQVHTTTALKPNG